MRGLGAVTSKAAERRKNLSPLRGSSAEIVHNHGLWPRLLSFAATAAEISDLDSRT